MKYSILFFTVMLLLSSCKRVLTPYILVDKRVYFDTINLGDLYHKTFVFSNPTKDTIFIEKIINSCDCIQVLNKDEIKYISPKDKDSLIVVLSPHNRGYISRMITVFLRDKQEPIDLIIEGYVK